MQNSRKKIRKLFPFAILLIFIAFPSLTYPESLYLPLIYRDYDTLKIPIAIDDQYHLDEGATLNGSPGVLENDYDPEARPLTATLVSDVNHGSLTFISDGTFTYSPNTNFKGIDTFTYKVYNGLFFSIPATVKILVGPIGSPPAISNLTISPNVLSAPIEPEQFHLSLTFDFSDPDMDMTGLKIIFSGPLGFIKSNYEDVTSQQSTGKFAKGFIIDSSFGPGGYQLSLELLDNMGNSSGIHTVSFSIEPLAQRVIEITEIQPLSGKPGDTILINGRGFFTENPSENKLYFNPLAYAKILEVTATQIKAVVPFDAMTGPITLSTPTGLTQSTSSFAVQTSITIIPKVTQVLTARTLTFSIVQSGARYKDISCSINGQTNPPTSLGKIAMIAGGFTYESPNIVPTNNPILINCGSLSQASVNSELSLKIVGPVLPPGSAIVNATQGGRIESVQGDAEIEIPPGALQADTRIGITRLIRDSLPIPTNDTNNLATVRLEPAGLQFSKEVKVVVALENWEPPGTIIPLYQFNETTGLLTNTGKTAIVDKSGLKATAFLNHFSIYVVARVYSYEEINERATLASRIQSLASLLPEFRIEVSPDRPLLEGLTVPVLIKRIAEPLSETGPFSAPSMITVSAMISGYNASNSPITTGPIIQASPDGWELGTVLNLGVLPDCGQGQKRGGTLTISYEKAGASQRMDLPFTITCLDELIFDGTNPPSFIPSDQLPLGPQGYTYNDLKVRKMPDGYSVEMLYPSRTYRFSKVDIGEGGTLTYAKWLVGVPGEHLIEVAGDVRVAGMIDLRGGPGWYGYEGGRDCDDCGGGGGKGSFLNAGDGGYGGPFNYSGNSTIQCYDGFYFKFGDQWIFHCDSGQYGYGAKLSLYNGGRGGHVWEKKDWTNIVEDVATFIITAPACLEGSVGACYSAGDAVVDLFGDVQAISKNGTNFIKSVGKGGGSGGENAPLDIAYFNTPAAGGGGGGAGKTIINWGDDKAGGGGGGGGGAAANLRLVAGGRVAIDSNGRVDGQGGKGGAGGDGEDEKGSPGGGGGGGSGSAVHIVALKGFSNNNLIFAPGGRGGKSGITTNEYGGKVTRTVVDTAYGSIGYNGRLRVDGFFQGADPIAMPFYKGPFLTPQITVYPGSGKLESTLKLFPGDFYYSYTLATADQDPIELKSISATIQNRYNYGGRYYETQIEMHPWQKAHMFAFNAPGAPTGLSATDGSVLGKVGLSWSAPTRGVTPATYKIYRSTSNNFAAAAEIGETANLSFDDQVGDVNTYWYWIRAKNGIWLSPTSNVDSGYPGQLPGTPTNLSASKNLFYVALTWTAPATGGPVSGYTIRRCSPGPDPIYPCLNPSLCTWVGNTPYTSYVDYPTPWKNYCYWVAAYNDLGVSSYSNYDIGFCEEPM